MGTTRRIHELAEELRALAATGLHYTENVYDRERYERLMTLAVRAAALADTRDEAEIERVFMAHIELVTPLSTADAAVFDDAGRLLLVQRSDCGEWCMPGGACDVGETPAEGAARECVEETGLVVEVTDLIGVYDSRRVSEGMGRHHHNHLFRARVVGGEAVVTHESLDFGWFTEEEAAGLTLFRGHVTKVPDAFAFHGGRVDRPVFH